MDIQVILQNLFVKTILVPTIITLGSSFLEYASALVKGKADGNRSYRVWIKELDPNSNPSSGQYKLAPYSPRSINFLYSRNDYVHIEPLINFEWSDFGSVSINLIMGAFAVDVASLLDAKANPLFTGWVLLVHLILFVAILSFLILNNLTDPENKSERNNYVKIAIALGFIAMTIAFFTTSTAAS